MPEEVHSLDSANDVIQTCLERLLPWLLGTCGLCVMCLHGHRGERITALKSLASPDFFFYFFFPYETCREVAKAFSGVGGSMWKHDLWLAGGAHT